MTLSDATVELEGERLVLMPERTLYWPARETLVAADLHLGKAASFRANAIPVPGGTTAETLQRLGNALVRSGAKRLLVLGDFWHARSGATPAVREAFEAFAAEHSGCELLLLPGNHDRFADQLGKGVWGVRKEKDLLEGPYLFTHHPRASEGAYVIAGHLHPAVELRGRGRLKHKAVCFWVQERVLVLPSLGSFTGSTFVKPGKNDKLYVLVEGEVVAVPTG